MATAAEKILTAFQKARIREGMSAWGAQSDIARYLDLTAMQISAYIQKDKFPVWAILKLLDSPTVKAYAPDVTLMDMLENYKERDSAKWKYMHGEWRRTAVE